MIMPTVLPLYTLFTGLGETSCMIQSYIDWCPSISFSSHNNSLEYKHKLEGRIYALFALSASSFMETEYRIVSQ
jgi:hypothetical protein